MDVSTTRDEAQRWAAGHSNANLRPTTAWAIPTALAEASAGTNLDFSLQQGDYYYDLPDEFFDFDQPALPGPVHAIHPPRHVSPIHPLGTPGPAHPAPTANGPGLPTSVAHGSLVSVAPRNEQDVDVQQSGTNLIVQQLRLLFQGLQDSGKLSDIDRLRFQLLEQNILNEDLRAQLHQSQSKLAAQSASTPRDVPPQHVRPAPAVVPPLAVVEQELRRAPRPRTRPPRTTELQGSTRVTKQRSAFDPASRKETALTRQLGACLLCRKRKERCTQSATDPDGNCRNCADANASVPRVMCIRTRLPQIRLYHTNTTEKDTWTLREEIFRPTELSTVVRSKTVTIELTQGHGHSLALSVSEFIPIDGDETSYSWTIEDGHIELPMPCYAVTSIQRLKPTLEQYMDENLERYIDAFTATSPQLIYDTFQIALEKSQDSPLLHSMLRLWIASRMVEKAWSICGHETLGMEEDHGDGTPYAGRIPIPPVMDSQFDQIVIQTILEPLRKQVLTGLNAKISRSKHQDWFEIYLLVFLLLNNIELSTAHDHKFANFHHHVTPGIGTRFEDYRLIENYFHSAQVLIAHFREMFNGHQPLQEDYRVEELVTIAGLTEQDKRYLDMVRVEILNMKNSVRSLRKDHKYERMLFWCHQLWYSTWDSSQVQIREAGDDAEEEEGPRY